MVFKSPGVVNVRYLNVIQGNRTVLSSTDFVVAEGDVFDGITIGADAAPILNGAR